MKKLSLWGTFQAFVLGPVLVLADIAAAIFRELMWHDLLTPRPLGGYVLGFILSVHYTRLLHERYTPASQERHDWDVLIRTWAAHGLAAFTSNLRESLALLHPPAPQVESVLNTSLYTEVLRMNRLTEQSPVGPVDLNVQFIYASGIADHYREHRAATIYATSLDSPAAFYKDHRRYFDIQVNLRTNSPRSKAAFDQYAAREAANLQSIVDRLASTGPGGSLSRHLTPPPTKARIVFIGTRGFEDELPKQEFWEFVRWHAKNKVGLKFYLGEFPTRLFEEYLGRDGRINDFIVYDEDCVFGRLETTPEIKGVTLGFHYAIAAKRDTMGAISKYKMFFEELWYDLSTLPRTHTLTEICLVNEFHNLKTAIEKEWKELDILLRSREDGFGSFMANV